MDVFSDGELTPEEREKLPLEDRIRFLEKRVETMSKFEESLFDSTLLALSQIHTIVEVLQAEGIVEGRELEALRLKNLETIRLLVAARGNGR